MKPVISILIVFFSLTLAIEFTACSPKNDLVTPGAETPVTPAPPGKEENDGDDSGNNNNNDHPVSNKLKITIGTTSFTATLHDNTTTTAFKQLLPMTVKMGEMNGNEKYYNLPNALPTAASNPGTIHTGDLMLWGSGCVVLFYDTFSTSYSYTRIGQLDDTAGLRTVVGSGEVTVRFESF